jgi:hypothetical protein
MLRSVQDLERFAIGATDGRIGRVKDFYFDDDAWVVRYIVVDTGAWLGGREVLISPFSIGEPDWGEQVLPVTVTKEQIRNSPNIDTDKPISRQYERAYLGYYGYPYYWGGTGLWGSASYPSTMLTGMGAGEFGAYVRAPSADDPNQDPHLQSCNAVKGYHIHASDGEIGHVQGFLVDDSTWAIRYLIANTSNWWVGHQVLVSPEWIAEVSWPRATVNTSLDRQAIRDAPPYDSDAPLDREAEAIIYKHYRRNGYWQDKREHTLPPGAGDEVHL